ncbi:Zinc finger C3HC4 RING-type [Arabidopsis thaliana x Arabidopsis arenosa]|uniref:SNF2 domain-containing protein / helicase domain-containing protein / zinc finger protein-like protein n=2 Tax=Arabidopsis TaxID=3701 RepID=A0A1I9LTA5_ARATH|nr:SNF2 domain-containing protein / helicase domain-containing protein / zinc finger protein-like protein [Arabidopsis thaliana]NP_001327759.1 SNF2 domain-containing protein / helicase domain-containing protein / zinc finger protein-like protein [Arabidopsis thaliana]NP_001327761.1 SNF2 domain-containing protein / helicase domain-containing protein / zinc finger protein-like protein [Arabidopsis thaliana]KAG7625902.1 Zinc finger C3HC4 RING-type [Arabidopsis thaliana x Arabidopsis arenosa]ANM658|eukprot:NP_001327756.1 SNF2 domain-containing protein / helicase domain-containing protein / zinc finger protein-like protein [Arabidopsis thaliana]
MDSAIEISSGSDSDDEVPPQPVWPQTRTRMDPTWLSRRPLPTVDSHARAEHTNQAPPNGASSDTSRPGVSKPFTGNGNTVNSRISSGSGADYVRLSSEQALKRTLPPSFNSPPLPARSGTNNISNASGSRVGVDYERPLSQQALKRTLPPSFNPPPLPSRSGTNNIRNAGGSRFGADYSHPAVSAVGNKSTFGDHYSGAHAEIGIQRGVNGVRILPPSLTHGTSASVLHHAGSSDPMHRFGGGEDRNPDNDERLVYQAALQVLNQPMTESDLPPGTLSVPLMRHQKIALAWMFQKETSSFNCPGGILADDQGLGKTVSTIALILKQKIVSQLKSESSCKQETEALVLDADDESDNAKHESGSHVKPELKVSSNSETSVLSACGNDENDSSDMEKAEDEEANSSTRAFQWKRPAAGTLIVCPASVVRQWARELDEKVSEESKLSVLVYHGSNRTKDPNELAEYDVVVTTYAIVTNEAPNKFLVDEDENDEKNTDRYGLASGFSNNKKRKVVVGASKKSKRRGRKSTNDTSSEPDCGPLGKVGWFRIVLDEAQTIKNYRTQMARSCCTLRAKRRWCLSGTPIQNTIDDLYSYFRFLRYDPYAVYKSFYSTIKVPISRNSCQGYKKLQAVLRAIMLRRTKGTLLDGKPIINLPPKVVNLSQVDFSVAERSFYKKLEADSRSQFKAYADAGTLSQNYANILLLLLRLRQACDHPQLVKRYNSDPVGKVSEAAVRRLPREARSRLINRLESSSAICYECNEPPEKPVVTLCGHIFCYECVLEYITGDENTCPVPRCKQQLARDVVFSESSLRNCTSDDSGCSSSHDNGLDRSVFQKRDFCSSKIKAVLDILQSLSQPDSPNSAQHGQMPSSSRPYDDDDVTIVEPMRLHSSSPSQGAVKTIIFSQWTGMLDLVELRILESGIEFRRLDGTMSLAARDRAVKEFSKKPDVSDVNILDMFSKTIY